ncbi:DUF262 domain-containing protein, partial [Reyranella sp.]|uniref:DUF262 domain-containing protein n=1 Tax=Reyranella sp. TaxID=1929291 RepID=UPI00387E585C
MIDSILRNYPLPAIFLYKREDEGRLVFDVIDGKQRLESIFKFTGVMRGKFRVRMQLGETSEWIDWTLLKRRKLQPRISGYEIPIIEADGEIADIIDLPLGFRTTDNLREWPPY